MILLRVLKKKKNVLLFIFILSCLTTLAGCSGGGGGGETPPQQPQPIEVVQTSPESLPAIWNQVRGGHWVHGVNWPWDNYGGDFGSNTWGYRGLANQGPSGWRRETRDNNQAAKTLFWTQRDNNNYCMGVDVELIGPLSNALVFFQIDELADKKTGETIDLSGQTVTGQFFFPTGIEGPKDARSGVMLFFQDGDWTWAQTDWMNIEVVNQWVTISANINDVTRRYSGFDPTQIRAVGIKVGTNENAGSFSYKGPIYVDNIKASIASEIQFDFNGPSTRTEKEMKDVADLRVKALRWWLFADGRAGLKFDENGFVTGLEDKFIRDFDEMIRLARTSRIYLVPVLFDFLMGGKAEIIDNVQIYGHADLITDPAKRRSLLDNAVSVIFDKLADTDEVVIVDLFNEPEWLLLDSDINIPAGKRPPEIKEGGIIALATMKTFFSEIIALHKQKGLEGKQLLSIGSASPRWVTLWEGLDLDIAQFHFWNGPGQIDEGLQFNFPPPISGIPTFLGEFSTLPSQNTCEFLETARMLGYSGAFPWAYRAKDNASLPLLGEGSRNCMSQFADAHPNLIEFAGDAELTTYVELESPPNNSSDDLTVHFRWRVVNPKEGVTYHSTIITDKGINPFDGGYEETFDAGEQTELTVTLDSGRYRNTSFEWGVLVEDSQGETYKSQIWRLHVQ